MALESSPLDSILDAEFSEVVEEYFGERTEELGSEDTEVV
jgi:hypothetical protein